MNFPARRTREAARIDLVPMIDILLVVLIFLIVTTATPEYFGVPGVDLPQQE